LLRHLVSTVALLLCVVPAAITSAAAMEAATSNPATEPTSLFIDCSRPITAPRSDHLKMGGSNPAGIAIGVNSRYLTLGGEPWLPVMGEFHFTRYPADEWERELLKMKAGGVTIVSTYVFWIHHEEVEGQFDWAGDHDLRRFIQLCAKHGLLAWVRLGPWCHGEVRNGGLPDWVLAKCGRNIRKNDPQFMGFVRTLYEQISDQVKGQLWKDGGPIIGVQLDNEMPNNPDYLLALKRLAQDVGFDVPLYSVTGWNGVRFPPGEVIPLFGGYADGFWEGGSTVSKQDRKQFFFNETRDDSSIGADLMPTSRRAALAATHELYPYVTCECGGGMETSYARRPLMSASDVAALALVKLGSGSNLLGYYMYHGGRNPAGKLTTLQESQATNYPNDMPIIRYDFQAPLGQHGQIRESYDALRMIHMFLADFGKQLTTMPAVFPEDRPKSLDDTGTLRWSVRTDGHRGFVFINNYQRGTALPERAGVQFSLKLADGSLTLPSHQATIPSGAYEIWPFNLDMNGVTLRYATAQLLCRVDDDSGTPCFVFFTPSDSAEFAIDGREPMQLSPSNNPIPMRASDGKERAKILLLSRETALHAYVADIDGRRRLIISPDGNIWLDGDTIHIQTLKSAANLMIFPPLPDPATTTPREGIFARFAISTEAKSVSFVMSQTKAATSSRQVKTGSRRKPLPPDDADFENAAEWHITIPADALEKADDVRLRVNYVGDVARAYVGDRLIDDNFYFGAPWQIGLRRFAPDVLTKGVTLKVLPLQTNVPIYLPEECRPTTQKFEDHGTALGCEVDVVPAYDLRLSVGAEK
jgi:hypothetical protein